MVAINCFSEPALQLNFRGGGRGLMMLKPSGKLKSLG